jgi:glycosyltransferase involved in cell wall biosynthesis
LDEPFSSLQIYTLFFLCFQWPPSHKKLIPTQIIFSAVSSEEMRILFARRDFLDVADGINAFLYAVIEPLLEQGDEVHLVGPTPVSMDKIQERFPCRRYPIFHYVSESRPPGWWRDTVSWSRSWPRLVRQIAPDKIVLNGVLPWRNQVSTLAINHDLEPRGGARFARLVRMVGYRLAQRRAATCTELKNALAKNIRVSPNRIDIIPTCLRLADFCPEPDAPKKPYALHIGTMPYKHPEESMAALNLVKMSGLKLLITGPRYAWVDEALGRLPSKVQSQIDLLGVVPASQLRSLMAKATAVLIPSGYAIPVLSPIVSESFASGAAVICTSSISRDLIRPNENCLVAEKPEEVASHLDALMRSPELNKSLGRQALQDVSSFDACQVTKRLREILLSMP